MCYEISHCLATKGISSPVPNGHYQNHIYTLQSGSQLHGGVVRDWLDFNSKDQPIAVCTNYCKGESILETWKRKFTFFAQPEPIQLPDIEEDHDYVVIPVVLSTLPFNHIVVLIYERETNTLEFYDSKGYSLLDHGDVMIAGTNTRLSSLFRAAYNKYCIPCRKEEGIPAKIEENITQHQFDKDACGVFVMHRIKQRTMKGKSWEEAQASSSQVQKQILQIRMKFANFFSELVTDNREINMEFPDYEEIDLLS
jgi:hypothetical protein